MRVVLVHVSVALAAEELALMEAGRRMLVGLEASRGRSAVVAEAGKRRADAVALVVEPVEI